MTSGHWDKRDWDKIAAELSSGEDSDAGDTPNVVAVQRNAHRVTELFQSLMPGLDPAAMAGAGALPPLGANAALADSIRASLRSAAAAAGALPPAAGASAPATTGRPPPPPPTPRDAAEAAREEARTPESEAGGVLV
jgi:hypothetical protein